MALPAPVCRLSNATPRCRCTAAFSSIVAPADPIGSDVEGARGDLAAMEADVVQGAVVKLTQLRDRATRRHPRSEAGECPSDAARHQAAYEVGRSQGAGARG